MSDEARFRTSKEAYDRLKWDPALSTVEIVIGYEDRRRGVVDVRFDEFVPGGRIPWHRIAYFREGGRTLWDRKGRVDVIGGGGDAVASAPVEAPAPAAQRRTPQPAAAVGVERMLRWDGSGGRWAAAEGEASEAMPARLSVATLNVLFDDVEVPALGAARRRGLVEEIEAQRADVVVLQEVKAGFAEALLASPVIRERYAVSDAAEGARLEPYGQLVLSRIGASGASVEALDLGTPKRAVIVGLAFGGGSARVVAVHLTSDRVENARPKRARQLRKIVEVVDAARADVELLVGDFNAEDDELDVLRRAGFMDVWAAANPGAPGYTYDPARNANARALSHTGLRRRFDRVFVRRAQGTIGASAQLFAEAARRGEGGAAPVSDHFGLRCELDLGAEASGCRAAPVYRSALMIGPPEAVQGPIQAIREVHDRAFPRWMPHINLLYGFVPEEAFEAACPRVEAALRGIEPFEVELARFGIFEHRSSATVYLEPKESRPGALRQVQRALTDAFPQCSEQIRKSEAGFTPHLTVGSFKRAEDARRFVAEASAAWSPIRFVVDAVRLISRREEEPFAVRHVVPIGAAGPSDEPDAAEGDINATVELAQAAVDLVLDADGARSWALELSGSHRIGTALEESDVDLVSSGPEELTPEAFFERVADVLEGEPRVQGVRLVLEGAAPSLRFWHGSRSVELLYVRRRASTARRALADLSSWEVRALDMASAAVLEGMRTAEYTRTWACRQVAPEVFEGATREVKRWARARGLYGAALGYPAGIVWTILVARSCALDPQPSAAAQAAAFFRAMRAQPLDEPLVIGVGDAELPEGQALTVGVLREGFRNASRGVTRSAVAQLRRALDAPEAPPRDNADHNISIVALEEGAAGLAAMGQARGRVISLVRRLEDALGAIVRVEFEQAPGQAGTLRLGLEGEADEDALAAELGAWLGEVPGVAWRRAG